MKIAFVTSNKGKVDKAARALSKFNIEAEQVHADLIESRSYDPEIIAQEKVLQVYKKFNQPVIVEDSGFFIRALGGFPMTHIKFSLQTLGIKKVLKMLEGESDRHAEWRMTAALAYGEDKSKSFTFVEPGEIALEPRPVKRNTMSEYWRIYIPHLESGNNLALSEMADEDLARWRAHEEENNHFAMLGRWLAENPIMTRP